MSESKKQEKPKRYIYVKDHDLTRTGFKTIAEASLAFAQLSSAHNGPEFRIRTRLRRRTGTWDVLVKRRQEVKEPTKVDQVTRELGEHAYPGGE